MEITLRLMPRVNNFLQLFTLINGTLAAILLVLVLPLGLNAGETITAFPVPTSSLDASLSHLAALSVHGN